jgi:hypothetical protein
LDYRALERAVFIATTIARCIILHWQARSLRFETPMKKSTLLIRAFLVLLVTAGGVVLSLKVFSPKAPTPSVAVNSVPPAPDPAKPVATNPGFRFTMAPTDPSSRQPTLSVLTAEKTGESAAGHPSPGLYTAKPVTGIVVVPGPVDEDFVKPVAPGPNMPTVEPPLQLAPRSR